MSRGGAADEVSVSPSWFLAFNFLGGICGQNGSAASKARTDCGIMTPWPFLYLGRTPPTAFFSRQSVSLSAGRL